MIQIFRAENDFECPSPTDQMWKTFRTAAAGMHSHPDFGLAESRIFARCEAHVAGEDELAAHSQARRTPCRTKGSFFGWINAAECRSPVLSAGCAVASRSNRSRAAVKLLSFPQSQLGWHKTPYADLPGDLFSKLR